MKGVVALVFIFTLLSGLQISLETEKLTYLPLEQVKVKAVVTYNGDALENQIVAFQLTSPNDTTLDLRTFITDKKGQATYLVRLPYNAQPGLWTVTATTNIGEINTTSHAQFFVPAYNITVNIEILPLWLQTVITLACIFTIATSIVALYQKRRERRNQKWLIDDTKARRPHTAAPLTTICVPKKGGA